MHWSPPMSDYAGTILMLCVAVFLGLAYFVTSRRPRNFPPGPIGLPIVGYAPFAGNNFAETFRKLKPKYGPVMGVKMGLQDWVILNDYEMIHDALVKQGEKFSGRPSNFIIQFVAEGYGIIASDYGPVWKTIRKFGLMTLRGFGVGKKSMEENIIEETPHLIKNLLKDDAKPEREKLTLAVSNIICRVVFGSRFDYDDQRFLALTRTVENLFNDGYKTKLLGGVAMAPVLRFVPPFRGAFGTFMSEFGRMIEILKDIIKEHEESFDENDIRDVIDAFIVEMKQKKDSNDLFCEKQLIQFIRDLFLAGTGSTSATLAWAILCFAQYPEYQNKIAEEARNVLGEDGIPAMEHRDQMPFTCAFIQELLRHRTFTPIAPMHKTSEDAVLGGYTIPKGTTVAPNLWAAHRDPNLFVGPEEFRPERFIDENGRFVKSNHVITFSVGPRHCLGEQLARMELFIFLVGIVQKLKVLPNLNKSLPAFETKEIKILALIPSDFTLKFEQRR